jgi:hypothetical protein
VVEWVDPPIQPPKPRRVARRAHHNRSTFPSPYYTFDVCTVRCTLHELTRARATATSHEARADSPGRRRLHEEGDPDCYCPEHRALVDIALNYNSDATQLGSDAIRMTSLRNMNPKSGRVCLINLSTSTEKEPDSSSHGSKPQLAPTHEWSFNSPEAK